MRRLTPWLLRAVAVAALVLLLWNPAATRPAPGGAPPLVLLDVSLSMHNDGARWQAALDSARAAGRGGVIWRFGSTVAPFDSGAPTDGVSRLGPALEAAAARGSEVIVVTDGELDDARGLAPDLVRRPRVIHLLRPPRRDAFVARVDGPTRVAATDTVRLTVTYGAAGTRETGRVQRETRLVARVAGRPVGSRRVTVPDSGLLSTEITFPAARFPAGWTVVEVGLEGVGDGEPRDDARLHLLDVRPEPHAVLLAAPPSWDSRFLAAALEDVARVPLRVFVNPTRAEGGWRDGRTLAPVRGEAVGRALREARLVVLAGEDAPLGAGRVPAAVLRWPAAAGRPGDWYVEPPLPSSLAGAFAGIDWLGLPPAAGVVDTGPDSGEHVVLGATLARRGPPRPIVLLRDSAGTRRATVLAQGLWRWQFRGGSSAVAYRTLVAALVDWLLGDGGRGTGERAVPERRVVPNGIPLSWRWVGAEEPRDVVVRFDTPGGARTDTLRFGAAGSARLSLPPGVYRYALSGGDERGLVAVETYSDEWRPRPITLGAQAGAPAARLVTTGARDRGWLFALAIAALVLEWAWRRRQGLP